MWSASQRLQERDERRAIFRVQVGVRAHARGRIREQLVERRVAAVVEVRRRARHETQRRRVERAQLIERVSIAQIVRRPVGRLRSERVAARAAAAVGVQRLAPRDAILPIDPLAGGCMCRMYATRSSRSADVMPMPPRRATVRSMWRSRSAIRPFQPNGAVSVMRPMRIGVCRGPSWVAHVMPSSRPLGWQLAQARPSNETRRLPPAS